MMASKCDVLNCDGTNWLIAFYISFQLIFGYLAMDDDNDDKIENRPPSQGQGFYIPHHIYNTNGMRLLRLVLYDMQEDT